MSPPTPKSPPLPPPPPNPPTYASQSIAPLSSRAIGRFGILGDTILSGPMGALDQASTQRKSLLGQ